MDMLKGTKDMENIIRVSVRDKIARQTDKTVYVCGNSDYKVEFDFDAEWDAFEAKTARFNHGGSYTDVVFTGRVCPVPVIENTWEIKVGVFAGNLHTTTPAIIGGKKSILCGGGTPAPPADDVYHQIMTQMDETVKKSGESASSAAQSAEQSEASAGDASASAASAYDSASRAEQAEESAEYSAANAQDAAVQSIASAKAAARSAELAAQGIEDKGWMYLEGRTDGHLYMVTSDQSIDVTLKEKNGRLIAQYA